MSEVVYWLDLAGVMVFALSGVIVACRSRMDPFGMLVLAAVTGVGGGTLRDLVLGVRPVFWVTDPTYLWVILAVVGLSVVGFHFIHRVSRVFLPVADAFGLALFTVIGTHKALLLEAPAAVAVLMGLLTGVAGGMIRDVLARRIPMVLQREIYATASIAGGITLVTFAGLGAPFALSLPVALLVTLLLRLAAIYWHLALPVFAWVEMHSEGEPGGDNDEVTRDDHSADRDRKPGSRVKLIRQKPPQRRP